MPKLLFRPAACERPGFCAVVGCYNLPEGHVIIADGSIQRVCTGHLEECVREIKTEDRVRLTAEETAPYLESIRDTTITCTLESIDIPDLTMEESHAAVVATINAILERLRSCGLLKQKGTDNV